MKNFHNLCKFSNYNLLKLKNRELILETLFSIIYDFFLLKSSRWRKKTTVVPIREIIAFKSHGFSLLKFYFLFLAYL